MPARLHLFRGKRCFWDRHDRVFVQFKARPERWMVEAMMRRSMQGWRCRLAWLEPRNLVGRCSSDHQ